MLVPNWTRGTSPGFLATGQAIQAYGVISVVAREQGMATLTPSGPTEITSFLSDVRGGLQTGYELNWFAIVPDLDKFTWSVTGKTGTDRGPVVLDPSSLPSQGTVIVTFPFPDKVQPGAFAFTLRFDATETAPSGKTISASTTVRVTVSVAKDPATQP